ncbi:glycosyltransferase family 2 protein [Parachlamydia sp.]|uniref:glycosyltransferase family 2 protein n=1 Tax=Parachlamydia sp. TaxID=2052048 RepID=UPI003D14A63C
MVDSIGIVFITHCAKKHLPFCLPPLFNSSLKPRILVVNSSSNDGTVELAQAMGAETLVIERSLFNHGSTRELARKHLNTDIVVMMTPDAYLTNSEGLEYLLEPILQRKASIAYARQIAHTDADFFESFPREFNYPAQSHLRGIEDAAQFGTYTFFCSNSCAAYRNQALDEIGGFPSVLLGEDTAVVVQLLKKEHRIAYVAEAIVHHSHRYSLKQEFERHFDTGLARKKLHALLQEVGSDSARGKKYVREMIERLLQNQPLMIPYAFLHILAKWAGYKIGSMSSWMPLWLKKKLSSQDFYWVSQDFMQGRSKML